MWIVSPWLRDIPVIDNTVGAFIAVAPDLPRGSIRLVPVLRTLLERGSRIVIATRRDLQTQEVLDRLRMEVPAGGLSHHQREELHAKGIVGDSFALVGSMNFTYNGVERLTEMLAFHTSPSLVAEIRLEFAREYGGHDL